MSEDECDPEMEEKMRRNPDLFSTCPRPKRLFCYDWAKSFVSPYVASAESTVNQILETVKLKPEEVVYDLGCGDGRFLIAAARSYNCRGIGVDLDEGLVELARSTAEEAGVSELTDFKCMDLNELQLDGADVIVMFLLPVAIKGLEERILQHLLHNPGAAVVSVLWEVPGCTELERVHCQGAQGQSFRVYSLNRCLARAESAVF
eukprot:CAMPEP_0118924998 /NCGR_PEP_ID=MMETSP1169-20130426/2927_1 /TAXON_ID=36882 /ORGANISM="Pyramimonas obovata, Strain CCMP722" /LENGTH=203 /DNA_ID=CAMNT_0006866171 /DNA_START=182 /DNA_END=793 /DNA_ORIENTATION=+